jgi:type II secretory pathway pseudopilin PulG
VFKLYNENMKRLFHENEGQTLIEVLVALVIAGIVIGALVIATLISLRNAQFSQNQVQATNLAQETMEKIRSLRDQNAPVSDDGFTSGFNDYIFDESTECVSEFPCYFVLDDDQQLFSRIGETEQGEETLFVSVIPNTKFSRQIAIYSQDVVAHVSVKVFWEDTTGLHESFLQTSLMRR